MPGALERIARTRASLPERVHVQVDGGVDAGNIREVRDAGATVFVAGNAIFGQSELAAAYRHLLDALA
jgi:ribulose-phosphate 3-epimerase